MITTDRQIQALKPSRRVYWQGVQSPHGGGLAIRVSTGGSRSWYVRYRHDGKQDAVNIGTFPTMRLKEARDKHEEVRRLLADGLNPKAVQRSRQAANTAAWDMSTLFSKWIASYAKTPSTRTKRPPSQRVVEQTTWRWHYYLQGRIGRLLVAHVDAKTIKGTVSEVADQQSREQARKCLSMLRAMLDHAEAKGHITDNPAQGIQPSKIGATKGASRDRTLDLAELRRLWVALDDSNLSAVAVAAIKLLILTGQRRGELLLAKWNDIDLDAGIWTLPEANTKPGRAHTVYLSDAALEILRSLDRHGEHVFPGRKAGQPIGAQSITTAILRLQGRKTSQRDDSAPLADMTPFHVHDLRRSFATGLGEHNAAQPHVIERMLNHTPDDALVAVYQRQSYAEEQRLAWQAWGKLIDSQVAREPQNVIPMGGKNKNRSA
ncbi:tyrosine-type recombinase/integrase [Halomonas almeriensis]|uniref:tyrosine-type recombinase/integrase n=1 Tax=Halomonas almeriensis TaxID=308163 RepID=UPI0025B5859A|nr:site-specific integrase [Halomonas almeriensis]MDN3553267.1 tyrosine-type recombinase/integrase [Halomonas almeriensis]